MPMTCHRSAGACRCKARPGLGWCCQGSPGRDYTHGGADGLDGPRVQFDVLADTDVATATLARAVCTVMQQAAEVGGTRFHEGFLEAETWIDEGEQEGGGAVFRVSQDFTFYHEEI
jgi:hypothetical protein